LWRFPILATPAHEAEAGVEGYEVAPEELRGAGVVTTPAHPEEGVVLKKNTHKGEKKVPKSGLSGKEGATDVPSWAEGERPYIGENGKEFAKRLCDKQFGVGNYETGAGSEYNKIKKRARAF